MNMEGYLITTGENVEELQLFNMTPPPPQMDHKYNTNSGNFGKYFTF